MEACTVVQIDTVSENMMSCKCVSEIVAAVVLVVDLEIQARVVE